MGHSSDLPNGAGVCIKLLQQCSKPNPPTLPAASNHRNEQRKPMTHRLSHTTRRLVLWAAFAAGLAAWLGTETPPVRVAHAAEATSTASEAAAPRAPEPADSASKSDKTDARKRGDQAGDAHVKIKPGIVIKHDGE